MPRIPLVLEIMPSAKLMRFGRGISGAHVSTAKIKLPRQHESLGPG
jgi:hypothetical protein